MIRSSKFPVRYSDPKNFPDLVNLKSSIRDHGLLQPIVIRPLEHGFEIVAGHRRYAACRSLRWRFIPCKIRELTDREAYEIQLTENLQRKSMDPIEEAEAYQKYVVDFGWGGVSELGRRIGKSEEYVSHRMQLLRLPEDVKEKVTTKNLSVSQALEIVSSNRPIEAEVIDHIVDNRLTVRQIRQMKKNLGTESDDTYGYRKEPKSKEVKIVGKSSLVLKIALSRIDDLIEDAHKADPKNRVELVRFLMRMRRTTHSMIDEALRYKKECSSYR